MTTSAPSATLLEKRLFNIQNYGTIPLGDAKDPPWIHCTDLHEIRRLFVGQRYKATFRTPLSTSTLWVERVA